MSSAAGDVLRGGRCPMRFTRSLLLAATLVTVAFPAMAHGGWGGGWRGGGWGWHGGWGGGWHGGWGWRGGWGFGYGYPGFYGYGPYAAAYYAPPPVYPPSPAPAVYYAPRPVYRHHYHHVAAHHRCSCYCCQ